MIRFVISVIVIIAALALAMFFEGISMISFINIAALGMMIVIPIAATIGVWGFGGYTRAFKDAFSGEETSATANRSARIWNFYEKVCYATAMVGFLTGLVLVLENLGGTVLPVGRGIAVCVIILFYAGIFGIVARMLGARAGDK